MTQQEFGALVLSVIRTFVSKPSWKNSEIDPIGQPVIEAMIAMGKLPANAVEYSHIEWAGVAEFALIPVCYWDQEKDEFFWFNCLQSGVIEEY